MMNLARWILGSSEPDLDEHFDDGIHSGIGQLVIRYSSWLDFIQINYHDANGRSYWSERHGCRIAECPNNRITTIKLDYPNEYLTQVSGYSGNPWVFSPGVSFIRSITFKSNKRTYGPFGDEIGEYFSTNVTGAVVAGFYGWSQPKYGVRAIGVHMKPLDYSYGFFPPKDLLPAGYSLQIKLKKEDDENTNRRKAFLIRRLQ